jgi:hypothetical protein
LSSEHWRIRPVSRRAERQWRDVEAEQPGIIDDLRWRLHRDPLDRSRAPNKLYRLKGDLRHVSVGDKRLDQWQYKLSRAGRVWFAVDAEERTVWICRISLTHPKLTE